MKKFFTLLAAASIAVAANAGTKVLYVQDFESVSTGADAGWQSQNNPGALGIESDEFGQYLKIAHGSSNGRTYFVEWGTEIYGENASNLEDGTYTLTVDYCPTHDIVDVKQSNAGLTIMANNRCAANQPFGARWTNAPAEGQTAQGYIFDLMQTLRDEEVVGSIQFKLNADPENQILLSPEWYTITLLVNTVTREVAYDIATATGEVVTSGTRVVPETDFDGTPINMFAEGIWVMGARCTSKYLIDNVKVSCESSEDVANTPSCALTRVGVKEVDGEEVIELSSRTYTINFIEGETLHLIGPDGVEAEVGFYDCDGIYKYTTSTSGTLTCWTTCGTAKSEEVAIEVDATPCALPEANIDIISVDEGYTKSYKVTVDNSKTPLAPTIFIDVKFVGNEGTVDDYSDKGTGFVFTVKEAGEIALTTKAYGYQATTIKTTNDTEFELKSKLDFVNMDPADIVAKGFAKEDDLNSATTSGEGNWTARKGMFYYDAATAHENEEGETVYDAVYPFGFISESDTEHVIHRYKILCSQLQENDYYKTIFPTIETWYDFNMQWKEKIGLIVNTMKKGDDEQGDAMAKAGTVAIKVPNLDPTDFVLVKKVSNYGRDMEHPVLKDGKDYNLFNLANVSEVYAATEETVVPEGEETAVGTSVYSVNFELYRIDTALAGVVIFKKAGAPSGIENVAVEKIADNAWYTIDGIKLDAPARRGIYIHNGKKVFVNK